MNVDKRNKVKVEYKTNFQILWDKAKHVIISLLTAAIVFFVFLAGMWLFFYFMLALVIFLFLLYIYNKLKNI